MSWKPSRSSGIMLDKFKRKEEKAALELDELLVVCNPPKFEHINKLSKLFYLKWLNSNKFDSLLGGVKNDFFSDNLPGYYKKIFLNNQNLVYKPALKKLLEEKNQGVGA